MHETLWNFDIQAGHYILTRRPNFALIKNKRIGQLANCAIPTDYCENKRKRKDRQIPGSRQRWRKNCGT